MTNPFREQFDEEVARISKKPIKWTPPKTLEEFLEAVRLKLKTSPYKDSYRKMREEDLHVIVRLKTNRVIEYSDVEEALDVAAYAFLIFDKLVRE